MRTTSALLSYLPAGAFVYGAVPNLGGKIGEGLVAAEQQAFENAAFRAWWNSDGGLELRRIVDRVQSVSSLLGDEVVFSVASAGPRDEVPMVMARVQAGKRAALASALDGLFADAGESSRPYSVSDELMVVSDSPSHLAWAVSHLGQGAGSPFAAAIGDRYRRGAGWLIGVDAAPVIEMAAGDDAPPVELAGMTGVKYLFLEQRSPAGAEENEVTVTFQGARSGMASWLADAGSGGAAEYLPADALLAGYVSMRRARAVVPGIHRADDRSSSRPSTADLAKLEEKLGAGFVANLTAAMGTEAAFALHGFSVSGPTWVMVALANDPAVIDSSLSKVVDAFNAELRARRAGQAMRARAGERGRTDVEHAEGGRPSIRRDLDLRWRLPGGGVRSRDRRTRHRDSKRRLRAGLVVGVPGPAPRVRRNPPVRVCLAEHEGRARDSSRRCLRARPLTELLAERDPVLVVFDGKPEQIHVASRTRLSGVIIDAMMLESLSARDASAERSAATARDSTSAASAA